MKRHHGLRALAITVLALSLCGGARAACPPAARHCIDAELLADLTGWAQRLSGLPAAPPGLQPVLAALPARELSRTVCGSDGSGCRGLVAVYDTDRRRVLYLDSLDMRDPTDQSFIVHELVHFLQHLQRGGQLHASCAAVIASEREAYAVQNRYLAQFKQWRRVGEMMRFVRCPDTPAAEPTVRFEAAPAGGTITALPLH